MEYRRLGKSSLVVSAMGLGCMGMSQSYGTPDDQESMATIHHAIDRGITMLDTADMYGGGTNEELVGAAIAKRRHEVIIATKFGNMRMPDGRFLGVNGKPEYVQSACEECLQRLKISTIDLFYLHRVDSGTPIEETIGAMARLIDQGKVRYLGLSEAGARQSAARTRRIPSPRCKASIRFGRVIPKTEFSATCRELGIGFVPYSPLGRGILTGQVKKRGIRSQAISGESLRDFRAKTFRRTCKWSRALNRSRRKSIALPHNWLWPGCWRRARTSCRFRAQSAATISTRILAPWTSRSLRRICGRLMACCRRGVGRGRSISRRIHEPFGDLKQSWLADVEKWRTRRRRGEFWPRPSSILPRRDWRARAQRKSPPPRTRTRRCSTTISGTSAACIARCWKILLRQLRMAVLAPPQKKLSARDRFFAGA